MMLPVSAKRKTYSDCMNSLYIGKKKTGNKSEDLLLSRFENIVCHYTLII